ncbi:MAG: hypothetical protein KAI24_20520 [Planctomycetes bacterium]|nr:hypothetical protein [Planctomycetota bacterium]
MILEALEKPSGYASHDCLERPGHPLALSNPQAPLQIASHVLVSYSVDEAEGRFVPDPWSTSLDYLASDLARRCAAMEKRLDRLAPGWREEVRKEVAAEQRDLLRKFERMGGRDYEETQW